MKPESMSFRLWVIYDSPLDYPGRFVVRCHVIPHGSGKSVPCRGAFICKSLDEARAYLPTDLLRLERFADDEPQIVEVWI